MDFSSWSFFEYSMREVCFHDLTKSWRSQISMLSKMCKKVEKKNHFLQIQTELIYCFNFSKVQKHFSIFTRFDKKWFEHISQNAIRVYFSQVFLLELNKKNRRPRFYYASITTRAIHLIIFLFYFWRSIDRSRSNSSSWNVAFEIDFVTFSPLSLSPLSFSFFLSFFLWGLSFYCFSAHLHDIVWDSQLLHGKIKMNYRSYRHLR